MRKGTGYSLICAVVPAQNEAGRVGKVVEKLLRLPVDLVVPVVNGSVNGTLAEIAAFPAEKVHPLFFREALGLDVPRAIGSAYALKAGATAVLFVDGDMAQVPSRVLQELKEAVVAGTDLALTDCYPPEAPLPETPVTRRLLLLRRELNRCLQMPELGYASPAHGPHAVSPRFLRTVPLAELAVPPVALCLAVRAGLKVAVATSIPHHKLGSPPRGSLHSTRVAATIIGDCLEALAVCRGRPRSREKDGVYYDGYDSERRRDILRSYLAEHRNSGVRSQNPEESK